MLSTQDNELLVHTGKGTPMGEYMRRFWMPALLAEEIPSPDCPPVRVKLLGENLVAYRNSDGEPVLVQGYCAHRQMDLFFGRNEENGLRCVYHGWKYDKNGACVDMPSEPDDNNFADKISITAYPCREAAGLIWAYLGPKDFPAEFPELPFNDLPQDQIFVRKNLLQCNYLQAMEGNVDSTHIGFIHRVLSAGESVSGFMAGDRKTVRRANPVYEVKDTDYGLMIGARRPREDDFYYWRVTQWLLPFHTMIANDPGKTFLWDGWIPIDDEHLWIYRTHFNLSRPITPEEINFMDTAGFMAPTERLIPGTYTPVRNKQNDYLIDRDVQHGYSYTGIKGNNAQDAAAIENQGPAPITDRTSEHLGTGDTAIIALRGKLLKVLSDFQEGIEPLAAQRGDLYNVRPIAIPLKKDIPFYEGAKDYMFV